ncbi:ImmA/IrrE family metallo-endopeptidase [Marinilactibacillus sp. GCM10026970]|uniref:ImmA/IrrE family metallo-endopeptidase n=1 Tax=Marinilactibacillus sp. GCM10026970 TaxID=3252642 RepID=UPI00360C9596
MSELVDQHLYRVIKKFKTRNPLEIAEEKNILVLYEDLGDILGYYNSVSRIKFIHINNSLQKNIENFVCAHELGHALIHPNENTPQLSKATLKSEWTVEREANEFATKLLIDGSHEEYEIRGKYDILDYYGLPYEMERFIHKEDKY